MSSETRHVHDHLAAFRAALAHDLLALAVLHNQEIDADMIARLRAGPFPRELRLDLHTGRGREATKMFIESIRLLGDAPDTGMLDELAADYAAIYLTHSLRASPYESIWLDEEGLAMQEPMFQIRALYQAHGLAVKDWRQRPDDHLVLQLQFVSHLLETGADLREAARFLDEHLLRWLPEFASRVASRCGTPFYAALAAFTDAYLDETRDLLAAVLDEPRPSAEEIARRMKPVAEVALPNPDFVPGTAPSW